ncbi:MAG: Spx/MgsR family RNA polymerase-binding regulatory protein [Planctomycetes bacterium]|nr:Spx/MgsR family RNA polymerase-binding regulatory protein [Planctomycetota bacterium]
MLTVYAYSNCDTCRKAIKRLRAKGTPFTEKPIREQPPSTAGLRRILAAVGGDVRRLFNTSGQAYRAQGISARLAGLNADAAIALLASDGDLCKRPMVLGDGVALVGFKPEEWEAAGL